MKYDWLRFALHREQAMIGKVRMVRGGGYDPEAHDALRRHLAECPECAALNAKAINPASVGVPEGVSGPEPTDEDDTTVEFLDDVIGRFRQLAQRAHARNDIRAIAIADEAIGMCNDARVDAAKRRDAVSGPEQGAAGEREDAWREALAYANKIYIQGGYPPLHMGIALDALRAALRSAPPNQEGT